MDKLLAGVESRREAVVTVAPGDEALRQRLGAPIGTPSRADRPAHHEAAQEQVPERIWRKDETLWGGPAPGRSGTASAG